MNLRPVTFPLSQQAALIACVNCAEAVVKRGVRTEQRSNHDSSDFVHRIGQVINSPAPTPRTVTSRLMGDPDPDRLAKAEALRASIQRATQPFHKVSPK